MGIIAPEGLYGSLNHLYGYADQNPIGAIDPYGLAPKDKLFGLPKKFWQWYHRNEKRPGDPDLDKDSAEQLHQEWKDKGKPGPDSKRNQNNYSVPDPISLGAYVSCLQGFMSCEACTLLGFPSPKCDDDFSC